MQHVIPPASTGLMLGVVCLLQFSVSLLIDRLRRQPRPLALLGHLVSGGLLMLSLFTTMVGFTRVMLKRQHPRALGQS